MQPVSFELPECSEKTLRFNCKSIRPGRFSVVGYVIILYGLTYKIYFSELKKFQREVKIKQSHQVEVRNNNTKISRWSSIHTFLLFWTHFKVIDAIPSLNVRFQVEAIPLDNSIIYNQDEKTKESQIDLNLFDGEEKSFVLELQNTSEIHIRSLEVACIPAKTNSQKKVCADLDLKFNEFSQSLPPGSKMIIDGVLMASILDDLKEARGSYILEIKYRGLNSLF